jgi:DNA ligase-1
LSLLEVDAGLAALRAAGGRGSVLARRQALDDLFSRATGPEQAFLVALFSGEVRQGALEGVLLDAVARAAEVPPEALRRAVMMAGDLGTVAARVLEEGVACLPSFGIQLFRPLLPMLADSTDTVAEAIDALREAILEWKLDGVRIQVHRQGRTVAVYTRNLNEVTGAVPEVVAVVSALPAEQIVLDGEVIVLDPEGRPLPFQDTMRRFRGNASVELPLSPFFFDVLHLDGRDVLDEPLAARLARLDALVPPAHRIPRIRTGEVETAEAFQAAVLARGHEGVMAKSPGAPYVAGRRGSAWLKIKTPRTLDLVVLAAEWGSGRREGWLSNLHLGARDPAGGFVMLGKTFKGMTDAVLAWQTSELLARETSRAGQVVQVRPELVVEVAFNEVQRSTQYPGGVALRFARIKGYRADKPASEADTIESVRALAIPTRRGSR